MAESKRSLGSESLNGWLAASISRLKISSYPLTNAQRVTAASYLIGWSRVPKKVTVMKFAWCRALLDTMRIAFI
jgi:hypothetical protein